MWRNWNPCALLVGTSNGAATLQNSLAVAQKVKYRTTTLPSNSTPEYDTQGSWKHMLTQKRVHECSIFEVAKMWKQPEWPSTDEQINKTWHILAIKRKAVLTGDTTWGKPESMLSEGSQPQRPPGAERSGTCSVTLMGFFWGDENVPNVDSDDRCTDPWIYWKALELYAFKGWILWFVNYTSNLFLFIDPDIYLFLRQVGLSCN